MITLWNARVLCPWCSCFLFNTYRGYVRLFVQGSDQAVLSKEGVTQGDLLSMMMYTVAIIPLICSLEDSHQWIQNWVVSLTDHHAHLDMVHSSVTTCHKDQLHLVFSSVLSSMPSMTIRAVQ